MAIRKKNVMAAFLVAIFSVAWTAPSEFTRAPYLHRMTSHAVLIAWRTRLPIRSGVLYGYPGLKKRPWVVQEREPTRKHAVLLEHLSPSTRYDYMIWAGGHAVPDPNSESGGSFTTFPEGNSAKFSFAVLGDSGTASSYQKRIAGLMAKWHPDFVLHTGDVVYVSRFHPAPAEAEFDAKFFSIYRELGEQVPFFPVLGNHDADFDNGVPYLENFYLPQNSPGHGRYYSFNCAQAHFDALDSNESMRPGSAEYDWFEKDLEGTSQPIKIAYFHHAVYSTGYHGSSLSLRNILAPLFKQFHVTLVFNGHDHDYERTKPIRGTTYVVTGGGGAALYPAFESSWTAHSETVYDFVFVSVNGSKIHLDAVNDRGKVFDQDDIKVKAP